MGLLAGQAALCPSRVTTTTGGHVRTKAQLERMVPVRMRTTRDLGAEGMGWRNRPALGCWREQRRERQQS
jgi:hypothetical protein